jgi:multisubunit Na+/H+ antiporter MnhF subunit
MNDSQRKLLFWLLLLGSPLAAIAVGSVADQFLSYDRHISLALLALVATVVVAFYIRRGKSKK